MVFITDGNIVTTNNINLYGNSLHALRADPAPARPN